MTALWRRAPSAGAAGRDRGAAAVEMALVISSLFAFALLLFPLGLTLSTKSRLQAVAEDTVRFASSAGNSVEPGAGGRHPSAPDVVADAEAAAVRRGLATSSDIASVLQVTPVWYDCSGVPADSSGRVNVASCTPDAVHRPGDLVTVALRFALNENAFNGFASVANQLRATVLGTQTVVTTATAREE